MMATVPRQGPHPLAPRAAEEPRGEQRREDHPGRGRRRANEHRPLRDARGEPALEAADPFRPGHERDEGSDRGPVVPGERLLERAEGDVREPHDRPAEDARDPRDGPDRAADPDGAAVRRSTGRGVPGERRPVMLEPMGSS